MKKRILVYLIVFQIVMIALIGYRIFQQKRLVLGQSVSAIKKGDVISSPSGNLKNFYELRPNSVEKEVSRADNNLTVNHKINADALNERFEYSPEKPDSTYRIIALGDSFTFGQYVETVDNWTEVLEDKLNLEMKCPNINKFEVINLGVPGYDTSYEIERFKRRGQKYSPDLVLWYFVDMLRVDEELLKQYNEMLEPIQGNNKISLAEKTQKGNAIFKLSRDAVVKKYGEKELLKYQIREIGLLKKYFTGSIAAISIPNMPQGYKDFIKQQAVENKYYYYGDSRNYYNMGGAFDDSHPNPKGHKIIAEDIFNYLKTNKIVGCD